MMDPGTLKVDGGVAALVIFAAGAVGAGISKMHTVFKNRLAAAISQTAAVQTATIDADAKLREAVFQMVEDELRRYSDRVRELEKQLDEMRAAHVNCEAQLAGERAVRVAEREALQAQITSLKTELESLRRSVSLNLKS